MVKHHVKRKGGKSSTTKKASKAIAMEKNIKEQLKDIDRFNGSSESEGEGDNNGDNNDVNEDDEDWESEHKGLQATSDTDGSAGSDSEDGEEQIEMKGEREGVDVGSDNDLDNEHGGDSDDDGDGDDLNGKLKGGMGMAGAMSKILASAGALSESSRMKGKESLVLAKTVTKHMKVITKEEREERAMKKKRAERRKKVRPFVKPSCCVHALHVHALHNLHNLHTNTMAHHTRYGSFAEFESHVRPYKIGRSHGDRVREDPPPCCHPRRYVSPPPSPIPCLFFFPLIINNH